MFNTLKYTKKLEEVGVSREQAETYVQIIADSKIFLNFVVVNFHDFRGGFGLAG